jgi:hypothetical protein
MGKQSTGKSYMLNQLSGSCFDTSGGRCTDGVWMTVCDLDSVAWDTLAAACGRAKAESACTTQATQNRRRCEASLTWFLPGLGCGSTQKSHMLRHASKVLRHQWLACVHDTVTAVTVWVTKLVGAMIVWIAVNIGFAPGNR